MSIPEFDSSLGQEILALFHSNIIKLFNKYVSLNKPQAPADFFSIPYDILEKELIQVTKIQSIIENIKRKYK